MDEFDLQAMRVWLAALGFVSEFRVCGLMLRRGRRLVSLHGGEVM